MYFSEKKKKKTHNTQLFFPLGHPTSESNKCILNVLSYPLVETNEEITNSGTDT